MLEQRYYQGPNLAPMTRGKRYRTVNNTIPGVFTGLLGAIQLLLWVAIIALEIVSVYYDAGRGTVYAGFWCSIIFFLTWISMFCYLCCGKKSGCGSYLVVINGISAFLSIALIVFTSLFINDPCLCFDALCRIPNWEYADENYFALNRRYKCNSRTWKKLPILKALLACATGMLACNLVFILTYLIVSIGVRARRRSLRRTPEINYQQQSPFVDWSRLSSYQPSYRADFSYQQQHQVSYPMHQIQRPVQWSSAPPMHNIYSEKF